MTMDDFLVPKRFFVTSGVAEGAMSELSAFDLALKDAGITDLNLVAYWRASGWADLCRPLGDDDFECN